MARKGTYKYSEEFQQRMAALCLRDPSFMRNYSDVIDPDYYDYDYISSIIRVAVALFERHGQIPSRPTMVEEIREYATNYRISSDVVDTAIEQINTIYNIDLMDAEAVRQRAVRFGQRQSMKTAVMKIAGLVDNDSAFDEVNNIINKALSVGTDSETDDIQLFGNFQKIPEISQKEARLGVRIPTGFKKFDKGQRGGIGAGEIWILMGEPGVGKTQALINIGVGAILAGVPVVHVSLGDINQISVSARYAARIAKMTIEDVETGTDEYMSRAARLDDIKDRYLRVKYWPSGVATPPMVRSYLSRVITDDDINPGLLIVDYPEECKPYTDNEYQNMGRIYSEFGCIGSDFTVGVWAASQVRRQFGDAENGVKKPILRKKNIADSWRKAAKADGIVSHNKDGPNRARWWVDKSRHGKDEYIINLAVDLTKCYMRQATAAEMVEDEEEE